MSKKVVYIGALVVCAVLVLLTTLTLTSTPPSLYAHVGPLSSTEESEHVKKLRSIALATQERTKAYVGVGITNYESFRKAEKQLTLAYRESFICSRSLPYWEKRWVGVRARMFSEHYARSGFVAMGFSLVWGNASNSAAGGMIHVLLEAHKDKVGHAQDAWTTIIEYRDVTKPDWKPEDLHKISIAGNLVSIDGHHWFDITDSRTEIPMWVRMILVAESLSAEAILTSDCGESEENDWENRI